MYYESSLSFVLVTVRGFDSVFLLGVTVWEPPILSEPFLYLHFYSVSSNYCCKNSWREGHDSTFGTKTKSPRPPLSKFSDWSSEKTPAFALALLLGRCTFRENFHVNFIFQLTAQQSFLLFWRRKWLLSYSSNEAVTEDLMTTHAAVFITNSS